MSLFSLQDYPIDPDAMRERLVDPDCGGYATFEGWVRNHNEGRAVLRLEYEAYAPLAKAEGQKVVAEALRRYDVRHAVCAHRVGVLNIAGMAVWVGVSAVHRDDAFKACRYIIDEVKHRLPVWKKEYYTDGDAQWVNCAACATHTPSI